MSSLLHALNIGTLATWLTVSGVSTVACVVHVAERLPELNEGPGDESEFLITPQAMGSAPPAEAAEGPAEEAVAEVPVEIPEELPALPEMPELPELAEMEPLPDVPDLPDLPVPEPRAQTMPKPSSRSATFPSRYATRLTSLR